MFDNEKTEWVRDMMGHDMESKTTEVKAIRVPIPGELFNLVLLDTPGFNNATQKDIVTLTIIGDALQDRYSNICHCSMFYMAYSLSHKLSGQVAV